MRSGRAWVLLRSGRRLDLVQPTPFDWDDDDLAAGLSRTFRWGGHSKWDLPLSVAQHSLMVLAIRVSTTTTGLAPASALRELLHDADEGLLGFDAITPLKPHLGTGFAAVTQRLRAAIVQRYKLRPWRREEYLAHKRADRLAAASEALHVVGWSAPEIRASLGITLKPLDNDPLLPPAGMAPWEPWPPRIAAALFVAKLRELQAEGDPNQAVPIAVE